MIDEEEFRKKVKQMNGEFHICYGRLVELFVGLGKVSESFRNSKVELSEMVLFYVEGLEMFREKKGFVFDISDYLNFEGQVYGLKVPESYEGVLKNVGGWKKEGGEGEGGEYLDYERFRAKEKEKKEVQGNGGIINDIKANFNFFDKPGEDPMEFSHQSINRDFANGEQMDELRKSKVENKIVNTNVADLMNTNFFTASKSLKQFPSSNDNPQGQQ